MKGMKMRSYLGKKYREIIECYQNTIHNQNDSTTSSISRDILFTIIQFHSNSITLSLNIQGSFSRTKNQLLHQLLHSFKNLCNSSSNNNPI